MSFSRVCLHVKGKFDLGLHIGIVDFEKSVHELFQVDIAIAIQIKDGENLSPIIPGNCEYYMYLR